jgi:flagellar hook protein FlgE
MSFQQGLSGLNAASKSLDVIGNNVANSSTVGFKGGATQFADVFAASLSGAGSSAVGIGTQVSKVAQLFTQGNVTSTNNPLDIAINGQGFYRLEDTDGTIYYSRNGQYSINKDGYIVNAQGQFLTGYTADATGIIATGSLPQSIYLDPSPLPPAQTKEATMVVNLDSREAAPAVAFDATGAVLPPDPLTYNHSTSMTLYDTLGNPHVLSFYFVTQNTAAAYTGTWDAYYTVDGKDMTTLDQIVFSASGVLQDPTNGGNPVDQIPLSGVQTTFGLTFPTVPLLNLTGTSQYGNNFGVTQLVQDGYKMGRLAGISTSAEGIIVGRYDNGNTKNIAQVTLAYFNNAGGLSSVGGNAWQETADSGQAQLGSPASGRLGVLQSAAVEEANVDLTAELVNMITQQRAYQASAQTIKTQDQVLSTLVNLR